MSQQGMTKRRYLIVLAALVLVVAVAVPALGGSSISGNSDRALTIAKKALKKAKLALSQDSKAATINFAGGNANGTVDTARSTAGVTVSHPGFGVYCVTFPGVSPATSAAVASATNTSAATSGASAEVLRTTPSCPDSSFEVLTKNESSGVSGYAGASNFVHFTILIP